MAPPFTSPAFSATRLPARTQDAPSFFFSQTRRGSRAGSGAKTAQTEARGMSPAIASTVAGAHEMGKKRMGGGYRASAVSGQVVASHRPPSRQRRVDGLSQTLGSSTEQSRSFHVQESL